jgi:8-oxo-dGTP diphosphatase
VNAPGVGCGAAIVEDGRLLLVKRLRAPEAGHWSLPGGKVDFGERVEDAVRREIREEVGLEIELTKALGIVEMIGIDGQHWVSPIYLARIVDGEARNNEPEKLAAVQWFPFHAPPAPLALAARQALRAI